MKVAVDRVVSRRVVLLRRLIHPRSRLAEGVCVDLYPHVDLQVVCLEGRVFEVEGGGTSLPPTGVSVEQTRRGQVRAVA